MLLWIPNHNQMSSNERGDKKVREAITSFGETLILTDFILRDAKANL